MAFAGYLLKFGETEFPEDCLVLSSYSCTPYQRHIWHDWLDNNGTRHIDAAKVPKAKVSLDTESYLEEEKMVRIRAAFQAGLLNETEQRYRVEFWDAESGTYKTAEMHMAPVEYITLDIWDSGPVYEALHIELEEF